MENTRQAERILNNSHEEVRRYMPGVLPRLAMTYFLPILFVLLVSLLVTNWLSNYVPAVLAPSLNVALNIAILIISWKILDNRTKATGLFVLYTHYSRHRRDLEKLLKANDANPNAIYATTELLASSAEFFIDSAEQAGVKPVEKEKN